ncbi:biogenesis of lysosome-related organelles complex 1 subunit 5 isoform X2 [Seriola dumerili]|uniref:biogenesis of lysosome-related organelles complex 1 subunit 5 isoform X2 n=1 Tax=Seriola dumerili TaxID=41447 RepID=UPI000BBF1D7A|nr:biogenesis of lysosome-related organelles complex 1 subunit 5 isoform X2 [Seriola dumerili]
MDKIAKDMGDIQSRLLHHRPIINAEIRYFVREFEERRGHRESRLLENLMEAANHMAVRVQQRELEAQQSTQLQMNMEHLKDEWAVFLKKQQRLKEQVDEDHDKVVGRLSTHYSEMKMDLTKFSPF